MGLMDRRVTVLDGGMGRELWRIGAPFRQPEWSALALTEGPEWVVQAHVNFIDAGARVITTNSYAIVPFHIGEERFAAEARDLATVSGRLAREAVAVAGSNGQTVRVERLTDLNGNARELTLMCRIDTPVEVDYYRNGGILQTVLRQLLEQAVKA